MSEIRTRKRWVAFWGWIILSISAILLAFLVLRILITPATGKGNPVLDAILGIFTFGILLPFAQWIIIRQFFPNSIAWLFASLLGLLIIFAIDLVITTIGIMPSQGAIRVISLSISYGAIVGVGQWLFLRQYVENALLWVFANTLGWGIMTMMTGAIVEGLLEIFVFSALPAIATGITLVYFLTSSHRSLSDKEIAV
jgi:hypothetical protein